MRALAKGPRSARSLLGELASQNIALPVGEGAIFPLLYHLEGLGVIAARLEKRAVFERIFFLTRKGAKSLGVKQPAIPNGLRFVFLSTPGSILASSGLHEESCALIQRVVECARLRGDATIVVVDLAAHFVTALADRETHTETIAKLGDPETVGGIIDRAYRSNRARGLGMFKKAAIGFVTLSLLYGVMWLWLATREAHVAVDYLAKANALAPVSTPEQQAWPIYRAAVLADPQWDYEESLQVDGLSDASSQPTPTRQTVDRVAAIVARHQGLLDAGLAGAEKPHLGLPLATFDGLSTEDRRALWGGSRPAFERSDSPSLFAANQECPPNSSLRRIASVLAAEMRLAALRHDAPTVQRCFMALLGMAQQTREVPTVMNQLVSVGMMSAANRTLAQILYSQPDSIPTEAIELLADRLLAVAQDCAAVDRTIEYWALLDFIQRSYSDTGLGVDFMVPYSFPFSAGNSSSAQETLVRLSRVSPGFGIMALLAPTRRGATDFVEGTFARLDPKRPLWQAMRGSNPVLEFHQSFTGIQRYRYVIMQTLAMSTELRIEFGKQELAGAEALVVALRLEACKRREGRYPDSLAELDSRPNSAMPIDHSTGKPLLYSLRDGKPLLYGRGYDGVDDGGWIAYTDRVPIHPGDRGDWVVYPVRPWPNVLTAWTKPTLEEVFAEPTKKGGQ